MSEVQIYTDGACRGNPGPGGWGVLLIYAAQEKVLYGGEVLTTNNRMELVAAIEGLESLQRPCEVILYTDSVYVRDGITKWLAQWKLRNWRTSSKQPVKNQDLWMRLDQVANGHQIDWRWVKGHSGNPGNEKADALANQGIDELLNTGASRTTHGQSD